MNITQMTLQDFCKEVGFKQYETFIKINHNLPYELSPDAKRFSYWELNTSNYEKEVADLFAQGKVILNHKICPISIVMEIPQFKAHIKDATFITYLDMFKIEDEIIGILQDESDAIEATGKLAPGFMFNIGVADGCAIYKVTKVTPKSVTVELRSHGDGYRDRFLGNGHKLSRDDFYRITRFGKPALFGRKSPIPFV
jgi:hypothetical protein